MSDQDLGSLPPTRGEGQGLLANSEIRDTTIQCPVCRVFGCRQRHSEFCAGADQMPGTSGIENLLEEIRYRIWYNTGCSDDAAEGAAAAVYDLFLDQKAVADDLLNAVHTAEWQLRMLATEWRKDIPGAIAIQCGIKADAVRAAIAKALAQPHPPGGHSHEG